MGNEKIQRAFEKLARGGALLRVTSRGSSVGKSMMRPPPPTGVVPGTSSLGGGLIHGYSPKQIAAWQLASPQQMRRLHPGDAGSIMKTKGIKSDAALKVKLL